MKTNHSDHKSRTLNRKSGWIVAFSGTGINLALGILYSWSVIAAYLRTEQEWSAMDTQIPYMIAAGVFAILMVPGGRIQDLAGPRTALTAAAVFAGLGLAGSGLFISVFGLSIFFGIFFGTAMGLGYSSATPPAIKWFPAEKRGLISGIVVSGFGLASVYAAPLTNYLLTNLGLAPTFLVLGISFLMIILVLSRFVVNPPFARVDVKTPSPLHTDYGLKEKHCRPENFEWLEMLRTREFYLIWLIFMFGSIAGLMIIGQLSSIVYEQSGFALGFILVAVLALFNAGGRVAAGAMFDALGWKSTLIIVYSAQAVNFFLFSLHGTLPTLILGVIVAGFCYGSCLAIFPALTASLYGVKNLGFNYGLVFTSWGAGGVFGGLLGGLARDATGSYLAAFLIAAALCSAGVLLTLLIKIPEKTCS